MNKNINFVSKNYLKTKKMAFTLVEVIVLISILLILSIIVFISINGYTEQSRDSARISDFASMKTSLELFYMDASIYPNPSDGLNITYSGSVILNHGIFGESVFSNLGKLDKLPVDPFTKKEYTYSVSASKNEYELGGIIEGNIISINKYGINQTNALNNFASAYVVGNYNGYMIKSLNGSNCNILSLPTILSNNIQNNSDIVQIVSNHELVYNGFNNLPISYNGTKFKVDGGFLFNPNNFVAYTDNNACQVLLDKSNYMSRIELLKGLQNSYKGSILEKNINIKDLMTLNVDIYNPSMEAINFAGSFVNNILGGKIGIDSQSISTINNCSGLYGDANELNAPGVYDYFNLCSNVISISDFNNISNSSHLTDNHGARDVYRFELETGKTYSIETYSPFNNTDTIIFLYNKDANKLAMNDDIDANNSNYRSRIVFTPNYNGYYYLGVMGFEDGGLLNDYTLRIMNNE